MEQLEKEMKNLDQINIYSKRYRKIKFLNEEECNEFNDECNDHNNHISNYKDKEKFDDNNNFCDSLQKETEICKNYNEVDAYTFNKNDLSNKDTVCKNINSNLSQVQNNKSFQLSNNTKSNHCLTSNKCNTSCNHNIDDNLIESNEIKEFRSLDNRVITLNSVKVNSNSNPKFNIFSDLNKNEDSNSNEKYNSYTHSHSNSNIICKFNNNNKYEALKGFTFTSDKKQDIEECTKLLRDSLSKSLSIDKSTSQYSFKDIKENISNENNKNKINPFFIESNLNKNEINEEKQQIKKIFDDISLAVTSNTDKKNITDRMHIENMEINSRIINNNTNLNYITPKKLDINDELKKSSNKIVMSNNVHTNNNKENIQDKMVKYDIEDGDIHDRDLNNIVYKSSKNFLSPFLMRNYGNTNFKEEVKRDVIKTNNIIENKHDNKAYVFERRRLIFDDEDIMSKEKSEEKRFVDFNLIENKNNLNLNYKDNKKDIKMNYFDEANIETFKKMKSEIIKSKKIDECENNIEEVKIITPIKRNKNQFLAFSDNLFKEQNYKSNIINKNLNLTQVSDEIHTYSIAKNLFCRNDDDSKKSSDRKSEDVSNFDKKKNLLLKKKLTNVLRESYFTQKSLQSGSFNKELCSKKLFDQCDIKRTNDNKSDCSSSENDNNASSKLSDKRIKKIISNTTYNYEEVEKLFKDESEKKELFSISKKEDEENNLDLGIFKEDKFEKIRKSLIKRKTSEIECYKNIHNKYMSNHKEVTISSNAYKVIDAPGLIDDYYLNLFDWSHYNSYLALGITEKVYIWSNTNNSTSAITKLCSYKNNRENKDIYVCSVNWNSYNDYCAVGRNDGIVDIWDSSTLQLVRSFKGHFNRINVLHWNKGFGSPDIFASGSKDSRILIRDMRCREDIIADQKEHSHEICGLKFSNDGTLLASGGNDNLLLIWDVRKMSTNNSNSNGYESNNKSQNSDKRSNKNTFNFSSNLLGNTLNNNSLRFGNNGLNSLNSFNTSSSINIFSNLSSSISNLNGYISSNVNPFSQPMPIFSNANHTYLNNKYNKNSYESPKKEIIKKNSNISSNTISNKSCKLSLIKKITDHKAAVKAIAWCPTKRNVLASGGGSHDQTIKFWNTQLNDVTLIDSVPSGSQVCNMVFSSHSNELISTHGYSQNQMILWNSKNLNNLKSKTILTGHQARVLYLALSPDGETIATAAGDETVRFWNVFTKKKVKS